MDIQTIMKILPHRYPILLVDRILELVPQEKIVGLKNITINEHFFQGHFPGHPIMPGVLILESMGQMAAILAFVGKGRLEEVEKNMEDKIVYFMSIDKAKFRKPVVPGDQLRQELILIRQRRNIASFDCKAYVGEELAAEAQMTAMILDRETRED